MTEVRLTWTWKLLAPLHCGSGESRAGYADRLVHVDANRRPIVPGDAVKGALRMSAEQVAAWLLKRPVSYRRETDSAEGASAPWVSEPESRLLALVFGGEASSHFSPGRLTDSHELAVFTSTAIDHESGTALEDTLRMVQFVRPGAEFSCQVTVAVAEQDTWDVATLMVAALAATENVGAKAGIGWGSVELAAPRVELGGVAHPALDLAAPPRLKDLKAALARQRDRLHDRPPSGSARATAIDATTLKWYRLTFTPDEPLTLGRGAEVSNAAATELAIRATTVRGACAQAWRRQSQKQEDVLGWLQAGARWSPGFPAREDRVFVPVPASLMNPKHDRSKPMSRRALFDDLRTDDRPDVPDPSDRNTPCQWVGAGGGWMAWDQGSPTLLRPETDTSMHVARDYHTGSKVTGALYSREAVRPTGQSYVVFAQMPAAAAAALPNRLLLGKRKSAGNGSATLTANEEAPTLATLGGSRFATGEPKDADVYVELLSPALVRDPSTGHPLRTLDVDWWRTYLGTQDVLVDPLPDGNVQRADGSGRRTAVTRRGGWMASWRHGRAAITTIDQGAVWRLRCTDVATADLVRGRFSNGVGQLGDRQHEGYGWVALDPLWLGIKNIAVASTGASESGHAPTPEPARPWPGSGELSREQLLAIVAALPTEFELQNCGKELSGVLHELARQARDARDGESVDTIRAYYNERVQRERPGAWGALKGLEALRDIVWTSPDHLRFALEGLLIRATRRKDGEA